MYEARCGHRCSQKKGGKVYCSYVQRKRINDKSTRINEIPLGAAEEILEKITAPVKFFQDRTICSVVQEYGMVALLHDLAYRLAIADAIDSFVHKRRQGASVGMHVVNEAINSVVAPSSTNKLPDWRKTT
jgi:hypothetical protein